MCGCLGPRTFDPKTPQTIELELTVLESAKEVKLISQGDRDIKKYEELEKGETKMYVNDKLCPCYESKYTFNSRGIFRVKYEFEHKLTTFENMFRECEDISAIKLSNINAEKIESAKMMFYGCKKLTKIEAEIFSLCDLKNASSMFQGCKKLKKITFLNSSRVDGITDMSYMFKDCLSLEEVDLGCYSTSIVQDMSHMFENCHALREIKNTSTFYSTRVKDMSYMFMKCKILSTLNLSSFDTTLTLNLENCFQDCYRLSEINADKIKCKKLFDEFNKGKVLAVSREEGDEGNFNIQIKGKNEELRRNDRPERLESN